MAEIKILGIDPSLNNFGLVKVALDIDSLAVRVLDLHLSEPPKADASTKKQVRKNSDDLRRARFQQAAMIAAAKDCALAVVEVPVGSQSARAMASYGICIGVLASCPIPLIEVTPTEVKLTAVGNKTATKKDMIAWGTSTHPEAPWLTRKLHGEVKFVDKNEHLADALAAIYAGLGTQQLHAALGMYRSMQSAGAM